MFQFKMYVKPIATGYGRSYMYIKNKTNKICNNFCIYLSLSNTNAMCELLSFPTS